MARAKNDQDFMEEVAAELRGDAEPADGVVDDEHHQEPGLEREADAETGAEGDFPVDAAALLELAAERDAFEDKFKRALADAENMRKRSERDRREAETYGGSKLARDMLPVYDSLTRALEAVGTEDADAQGSQKALIEGIELTIRELRNVFGKHGIHLIEPKVGERFDPKTHEAMFEAPVPGTKAGDIVEVMANGFTHHERLLRPAQVGVSSTP